MDVAGGQEHQPVQLLGVDGFHASHLSQRPICGACHVAVGEVRVVVHVNGHLDASTSAGRTQHLFLGFFGRTTPLFVHHTALKRRQLGAAVEIHHGVRVALHLSQVVLLSLVVETSEHVVGHQHERAHYLAVVLQFERLKLRHVFVLLESAVARRAHGQHRGMNKKALEFKVNVF